VLSEEDMDQILSPTFSAEGSGQQPSVLSETNSADSIIRRVEQEIAAARKAAMHKNSNGSTEKKEEQEDDAADMANILNTNNSLDCNNNDQPDDHQPPVLRTTSSSDSSKDRAMDMIRDEFQALEKEEEKQKNNESLSSQTSAAEPNPNNSTITTTSVAEPNPANTSKKSNESLSSLTPAAEPKVKTSTAPTKSDLYSKPVHIHLSYEQWQNQKRASATSSPVASTTTAEEKKIDLPAGVEKQGNNRFPPPQTPPRRTKREGQTSDDKGAIPMDEARADKINEQWAPSLSVDPSSPPRHPHRTPTPSSRDGTPARNNLTSPRDPEGNYAVSPRTPPAVRPGMTRTRELLENLKEQRESIASRSVGSISTVSSTAAVPAGAASSPTMQRAAQLNFTRANRANEVMRGSPTATATENLKEESPVEQEPQQQQEQQQQESSLQDAATDGATTNGRNPTAKRVTIKPPPTTEPGDKELISPRRTAREVAESISRQSYKIRFRNPFPVLKSPEVRRDPEAIIQDHSMGLPEMPVRWVRPKKELRQLIVAAMGTSLPRRSNACGALKVLTKNKKNQLTLARTDGFLGALIFAASQSIADADRDLAIDARTRAVTCLKNVCDPKDNRVIVFSHPGVVECLVKVLKSDTGEGRAMAAAAIAMLAKTPSCREGLARSEELVDVVSKVLQGAGCLMEDEEELSVPLCPSPKSHYSRKMDDSVSAFSDHSGGDDRDEDDDDEDDDEDRTDDDASASSLSSAEEPPTAVINARPVKHVDSIKNLTEERRNEFVRLARSNACAALLHLSKQCAISVRQVVTVNHVYMYMGKL